MPPHIVRYPPIQCNTRERCDQLQISAAPPAWRVPEGPDNLAAAPMGGDGAWPGFEATHNRASAAGVEGAGGSGGHGRASRSTTPSEARVWRSRGRPGPKAPGNTSSATSNKNPGTSTGPGVSGGGWGIRTPEGLHPTRFPSVRHRPLGESSVHIVPDNHKQ